MLATTSPHPKLHFDGECRPDALAEVRNQHEALGQSGMPPRRQRSRSVDSEADRKGRLSLRYPGTDFTPRVGGYRSPVGDRQANRSQLTPVRTMRKLLRERQMEKSGVTGTSIGGESRSPSTRGIKTPLCVRRAAGTFGQRTRGGSSLLTSIPKCSTASTCSAFRAPHGGCPTFSSMTTGRSWSRGDVIGELDSVNLDEI